MQNNFEFEEEHPSAVLSQDRQYRYLLSRAWSGGGKTVGFICLNPSTADAENDDPTVRRCIRFAKDWGGSRLIIGNLFAYRATDPSALRRVPEPIGEENNIWLDRIADECDILIAAWGTHGKLYSRDQEIKERFAGKLKALRLTACGSPGHPLYLPGDSVPFEF